MKEKKKVLGLIVAVFFVLSLLPFISAGVGIVITQQTALVPENSNVCLTYGIYNPWPTDSYVRINLSDSLQSIVTSSHNEIQMIPAYTYHNDSIPVKFCFRTPEVYTQDCKLFNTFLCSQSCSEPQKVYSGTVDVLEAQGPSVTAGSSGSSTSAGVSAPLTVKVLCNPHGTDYSIIYVVIGLIALVILLWRVSKRKKKGKKSKK